MLIFLYRGGRYELNADRVILSKAKNLKRKGILHCAYAPFRMTMGAEKQLEQPYNKTKTAFTNIFVNTIWYVKGLRDYFRLKINLAD